MNLSKFGVIGLDQVVSSATTFFLSVGVASGSTSGSLGTFALIYAVVWLGIGLCRASLGEIALAALPRGTVTRADRQFPISIAWAFGLAVSLLMVVPYFATRQPVWLAGAAATPFLVGQDVARYIAIGAGRPWLALVSDSVMLIVTISGGLVIRSWWSSEIAWISSWGMAALAALALYASFTGDRISFSGGREWRLRNGRMSRAVGFEFLLNSGAQQLVVLLIPTVASLDVLGIIKAGQIAVAPLNVALSAVGVGILPVLGRAGHVKQNRVVISTVGVFSMVSAVYWYVANVNPFNLFSILLGASWQAAGSAVFAILVLQLVVMSVVQFGGYLFRVRSHPRELVAARMYSFVPVVLLPLFGAWRYSEIGGAAGLLVGTCVTALIMMVLAILHGDSKSAGK